MVISFYRKDLVWSVDKQNMAAWSTDMLGLLRSIVGLPGVHENFKLTEPLCSRHNHVFSHAAWNFPTCYHFWKYIYLLRMYVYIYISIILHFFTASSSFYPFSHWLQNHYTKCMIIISRYTFYIYIYIYILQLYSIWIMCIIYMMWKVQIVLRSFGVQDGV